MKIVSAREAADLIHDGANVGLSAFGGWLGTDELYSAIRQQYETQGHPRNLRIHGGILPGDLSRKPVGMNLLAKRGLISHVTAAHIGMAPAFAEMIDGQTLSATLLPLGVFVQLLRASAGKKPGVFSKIGLGTFCDPRVEGGSCRGDMKTGKNQMVDLITLNEQNYLFYKSFDLDFCLLRASIADRDGNLSVEKEPIIADQFEMASVVHNCGGIVIAQVSKIVDRGAIHPKDVAIHGSMVDYVVVAPDDHCAPGYDCPDFRPELVGDAKVALTSQAPHSIDHRLICARRGALELKAGSIVNLGIGIPAGIAAVAQVEGIADDITLSVESGPLGGIPVSGVGFGASVNPQAMYTMANNFDFYDGGGLDIAFLGAAEIDKNGNVNVSQFNGRVIGPGGFINISQSTRNVCFMGTFTADKLKTRVENGQLRIINEGTSKKFVKQVEQITFSAKTALDSAQNVLYITERAVFKLTAEGLMLTEIAPGMDIERDILSQMDFLPIVSDDLREMDPRIFRQGLMGIAAP